MARIHKLVKAFGSQTIGTSNSSLEKQTIKPLGDVVSWQLFTDLTTTVTGATESAAGGTPSGSVLGASVLKFFNSIVIKDNQNSDVFESTRDELYFNSYLLSIIDADESLLNKGGIRKPRVSTGAETALEETFNIPQRIAFSDLPATIEITLGVLADYWTTVGSATAVLNQVSIYVRYMPSAENSFTERVKSFSVTSFSADQDIGHLIPEAIEILKLAVMAGDPTVATAAATMNDTRITNITFKRGANDEIDTVRTEVLTELADGLYPNRIRQSGATGYAAAPTDVTGAPLGLKVIPTLAFVKTDATEFKFDVSASIQPHVFYVYK